MSVKLIPDVKEIQLLRQAKLRYFSVTEQIHALKLRKSVAPVAKFFTLLKIVLWKMITWTPLVLNFCAVSSLLLYLN